MAADICLRPAACCGAEPGRRGLCQVHAAPAPTHILPPRRLLRCLQRLQVVPAVLPALPLQEHHSAAAFGDAGSAGGRIPRAGARWPGPRFHPGGQSWSFHTAWPAWAARSGCHAHEGSRLGLRHMFVCVCVCAPCVPECAHVVGVGATRQGRASSARRRLAGN